MEKGEYELKLTSSLYSVTETKDKVVEIFFECKIISFLMSREYFTRESAKDRERKIRWEKVN